MNFEIFKQTMDALLKELEEARKRMDTEAVLRINDEIIAIYKEYIESQ